MTTINDIFNNETIKTSLRLLNDAGSKVEKTDKEYSQFDTQYYLFMVAVNRECDKAGISRHFNIAMPEDLDTKHKDVGDALANKPQNQHHKPKKK